MHIFYNLLYTSLHRKTYLISVKSSIVFIHLLIINSSRHAQGLHIAATTHIYIISSKSGVHPPGYAKSIPSHKPPPFIPILACSTFKPLFFRQSFTESIHLFRSHSTKRLPTHSPKYTLLAILSFPILSILPNHRRKLSSVLPFILLRHPTHLSNPGIRHSIHSPSTQQAF